MPPRQPSAPEVPSMVGGTVSQVLITDISVLVEVTDKVYGDKQWRSLPLNRASRCIGVGDALWWQNHQGYWTPSESTRSAQGFDRDVCVGKCWAIQTPETRSEA